MSSSAKTFWNDTSLKGPIYMLIAALIFTCLNVCIKYLGPQYTLWQIGFFRFAGGMLLLMSLSGFRPNSFRGSNNRLLIIRGCTGTIAFLALIVAVRMLPISTALVIFYSFPAFAAVSAFAIYGERIGKWQMGCIAMALIGICVLFGFHLTGNLMGQIAGLVAGIFAGVTVTLIRSLRATNGPAIIYLYFCAAGAMVTFPFFVTNPIVPANPIEWALIAGIILTSVAAQLTMNQGFYYCRGWEGGVWMSSEVVFSAIAGIIFMGDPAGLHFYIGATLIIGSVVALSRIGSTATVPE